MKLYTEGMKKVTAKYAAIVSTLEHQRSMEVIIAGHIKQGRFDEDQLAAIGAKIEANHAKLARKVAKFTGVNDILS